MRRACASLLLVATLVASREAGAQCSGGKATKITAFTVTPTALALPAATSALFNTGWSQSSYSITVTPQSGQHWYLCVSTASLSMGTVNGYTKPLGDLQFSLDGTTWTSFVVLTQQPIIDNSGALTLTVFIRARLQYANDIPQANFAAGTYSANLSFTVSM
jgi:hypothetical protein